MPNDTYEFIRDFQTLLVGCVGFLGVIVTLTANAWVDRQADKQSMRQRKLSVIAAVTAELSLYRSTFARICSFVDDAPEEVVVPRILLRHFDAVSSEIGLLGPDLCEEVLNAILAIEEINSIFALEALESTEYNFAISGETLNFAVERMTSNDEVIERALFALTSAHSAKR